MCSCYCINSGGRGTSFLIGRVTGRGSVKLYNFDSIWTLFLCGEKKTGGGQSCESHAAPPNGPYVGSGLEKLLI